MFTVAFGGVRQDGSTKWIIFKNGREIDYADLCNLSLKDSKEIGDAISNYRRALQR